MISTTLARSVLVVLASALLVGGTVVGGPQQNKKLEPGDRAPGLDGMTDWIQGESPDLNEGVIVVEFWATWCVPCRRVIPHLNTMQKNYGRAGLKIVGVASQEQAGTFEANVDAVKSFVKSRGDGMSYIIGVDNTGEVRRRWMDAAGIEGIPATFVVGRNGRVLWIGRPQAERFEQVVKLALKNKFDPILTPKAWERLEVARRAAGLRNWREAYQQIDEAVRVDPPLFGWLIRERYKMTLEQEKNPAAAKAYLQATLPSIAGDPYSLQEIVEAICRDVHVSTRDLDSAMVFAEQMKRACGPDPAPGMAAIALVHATKGELDKAVEVQTNAWLAAATMDKDEYKRVLDEYQNIKLRMAQKSALAD